MPLSEDDLKSLVEKTLTQRDQQALLSQNLKMVDEELNKSFGTEALEVISNKAKELGMSMDRLKEIAQESPNAFFTLIGEKPRQTNPLVSGSVRTEGVNMSSSSDKNFAYYQQVRRENKSLYFSPKFQQQMMAQADKLGEKFYSLFRRNIMAGNTVATLALAKRAEVWSAELKEILRDELQGMKYVKWLDQFPDGDTFKIPSIGDATLNNYTEDTAVTYDPIDDAQFTFTITEYLQSGNYITNKAMQDVYYANEIMSQFVPLQERALMERLETDIMALGGQQTVDNGNAINGVDHRCPS